MPEGGDAEVLEMLVGQIVKERKIDVVLGKGPRVLAYSDMPTLTETLWKRPATWSKDGEQSRRSGKGQQRGPRMAVQRPENSHLTWSKNPEATISASA
jgi:hypothetical protein